MIRVLPTAFVVPDLKTVTLDVVDVNDSFDPRRFFDFPSTRKSPHGFRVGAAIFEVSQVALDFLQLSRYMGEVSLDELLGERM
jgi:hypothetical protein